MNNKEKTEKINTLNTIKIFVYKNKPKTQLELSKLEKDKIIAKYFEEYLIGSNFEYNLNLGMEKFLTIPIAENIINKSIQKGYDIINNFRYTPVITTNLKTNDSEENILAFTKNGFEKNLEKIRQEIISKETLIGDNKLVEKLFSFTCFDKSTIIKIEKGNNEQKNALSYNITNDILQNIHLLNSCYQKSIFSRKLDICQTTDQKIMIFFHKNQIERINDLKTIFYRYLKNDIIKMMQYQKI